MAAAEVGYTTVEVGGLACQILGRDLVRQGQPRSEAPPGRCLIYVRCVAGFPARLLLSRFSPFIVLSSCHFVVVLIPICQN